MSEWISVKDRLPFVGVKVLVRLDNSTWIAHISSKVDNRGQRGCGYVWLILGSHRAAYPTHWQPMPDPPKEAA